MAVVVTQVVRATSPVHQVKVSQDLQVLLQQTSVVVVVEPAELDRVIPAVQAIPGRLQEIPMQVAAAGVLHQARATRCRGVQAVAAQAVQHRATFRQHPVHWALAVAVVVAHIQTQAVPVWSY